MTPRQRTQYVLAVAICALVSWEIYTLTTAAPDDTISAVIWGVETRIVPFLAGVLCGHLFWPPGGYNPRGRR